MNADRRPGGIVLVTLLAVLLLAYGVRVYRLQDASVWWDEGYSDWISRQTIGVIADQTAQDVHPPLYYWLLHVWLKGAGNGEFSERWLSVAFGVLTVAALWQLARALAGPRVAVLAALLLALSRFSVEWSQEIRMYTLASLLVVLSLLFMVRLKRRWTWRVAIAYGAVTAAALWTLYLLAFVLVAQWLYWATATLARRRDAWRNVIRWLGLQAVVLLCYLPWLMFLLPRLRSWSAQEPADIGLFVRLYSTLLTLGISTDIDRYLPIAATILIGTVIGAGLLWRERGRRSAVVLPALVLLTPLLGVWALTEVPFEFGYAPRLQARYLMPFSPAFALLMAAAIGAIAGNPARWRARWRAVAAGVLGLSLVGVSAWSVGDYLRGRYRDDDYASLASTLRAYQQPGDAILLHTDQPWPVFRFHWRDDFERITYTRPASEDTLGQINALWPAHDGVWLVLNNDALRADPDGVVAGFFEQHALAQHTWHFGVNRLTFYARTPDRSAQIAQLAPAWHPPGAAMPIQLNGMQVEGWEQALERVRAGSVAHVYVTIDSPVTVPLTLSLGESGAPVASTTVTPTAEPDRQRLEFDVRIPASAAAGEYAWSLAAGRTSTTIGHLTVIGGFGGSLAGLPEGVTPVRVTFGQPAAIELLGYTSPNTLTPGGVLPLTVYWRALQPIDTPYKVFTHILGADQQAWGQKDDTPVGGLRPTTSWSPDEVIADPYEIPMKPDSRPGTYRLVIGFYDGATGARLGPVMGADGQLLSSDQAWIREIEVR